MTDIALNTAIWWAPVVVLAGLLAFTGTGRIRSAFLLAGILAFIIYYLAIAMGTSVIPINDYLPDTGWNWGGKILSIVATLAMIAVASLVFREAGPARMGLTVRQNPGSVLPAILVAALCVGLMVGLNILFNDGPESDPARLVYQAVMPGLDEELFYRGLLLLLMNEAFSGKRFNLAGAPIGWGGLAVTLVFALGHGMMFQDGQFAMSIVLVVITGLLGFALLWIRERTGSLLLPVLAHNAINFIPSFF